MIRPISMTVECEHEAFYIKIQDEKLHFVYFGLSEQYDSGSVQTYSRDSKFTFRPGNDIQRVSTVYEDEYENVSLSVRKDVHNRITVIADGPRVSPGFVLTNLGLVNLSLEALIANFFRLYYSQQPSKFIY